MGIEGRLNIGLATNADHVAAVSIDSTRPVRASRMFHGKGVVEVLKMLPMLFTICGTAQACAAVRACEQALAMSPAPGVETLRESLVRMETLREHMWRILLDWPGFLAEAPEHRGMAQMLELQRDYRQALMGEQDPFVLAAAAPGAEPQVPQALAEKIALVTGQAVFDMSPCEWLDIGNPEMLGQWASSGSTVAARLIDRILQSGWSDLGACDIKALPALETGYIHRVLQDENFVAQPQWYGECRESTCLTRLESALLTRLQAGHGNGLLVRLVARLTEIAQLSVNLTPLPGKAIESPPGEALKAGVGQVAAARGQLLHRVQLAGDVVTRYQILAPTEWNFHPEGVVARSLAGMHGDREQMESQARLLINAIDPCVGYELSIT